MEHLISGEQRRANNTILSLKAFSFLAIFFYHYRDYRSNWGHADKASVDYLYGNAPAVWGYLHGLAGYGYFGVYFFVFASGYGLYASYLNNHVGWGTFYKKRLIRIIPLYWSALLLKCTLEGFREPVSILYNMSGISILTEHYFDFGELWYVSLIILLYLIFPFLAAMLGRKSRAAGLLAGSILLMVFFHDLTGLAGLEYKGAHIARYLPCFIAGMLLAGMVRNSPGMFHRYFSPWKSVLYLLPLACMAALGNPGGRTASLAEMIIFFCVLCVALCVHGRIRASSIPGRVISMTAYGSYTFYLFHYIFILMALRLLSKSRIIEARQVAPLWIFYPSDMQLVAWGLVLFATGAAFSAALQYLYDAKAYALAGIKHNPASIA